MCSISDKLVEEETMVGVGEQNIYLKSPIPWFQTGVDLGAASWLVTRLESRCESPRCENIALLVVAMLLFFIDMPFTNMVDCNSLMLQAGVEPYILPKNDFIS